MKKLKIILFVLIIALVFLSACSSPDVSPPGNQVPEPNGQDVEPEPAEPEPAEWPATIEEGIMIEGMEEQLTLHFYDGGTFVTYVPQDMLAESIASGDAHWFYANYGGTKNEDVYLKLFFFPETNGAKPFLTEEKERLSLQDISLQRVADAEKIHDWSLEEYKSVDGAYAVYVILGEHQAQYFSFVIHYPWEFGDGFEPRVNKIMEHLYWTDTDEYLL